MGLLSIFSKNLHVCRFTNPIVSRYVSFNERAIIFKCSCGNKQVKNEVRRYEQPFSMETTNMITAKEFNDILNQRP